MRVVVVVVVVVVIVAIAFFFCAGVSTCAGVARVARSGFKNRHTHTGGDTFFLSNKHKEKLTFFLVDSLKKYTQTTDKKCCVHYYYYYYYYDDDDDE